MKPEEIRKHWNVVGRYPPELMSDFALIEIAAQLAELNESHCLDSGLSQYKMNYGRCLERERELLTSLQKVVDLWHRRLNRQRELNTAETDPMLRSIDREANILLDATCQTQEASNG